METQNNTDIAGPLLFALVLVGLVIGIIWALS